MNPSQNQSPNPANPAALALLKAEALIFPDPPITFASGMVAPVYTDVRQLIAKPKCWRQVIGQLTQAVAEHQPEVVAGVATGGIPHSTAAALELELPSCFIRLNQKGHGRGRDIEGAPVAGRRVMLVEDVVTTGGSSLKAIEVLREAGAEVLGCVTIGSYGFAVALDAFASAGVPLKILAPFPDILAAAEETAAASPAQLESARQWFSDPHGWADQNQ